MRNKNRLVNIILALMALVLACMCVVSVATPIMFAKKQEKREAKVKERLVRIREAQAEYKNQYGKYCHSLDTLVSIGLLAETDIYIPYSDGMPFELLVDSMRMRTGEYMSLMQCGARYEDYLYGMDEAKVRQLTDDAGNMGRYPGLVIGDTDTPNGNAGNWEK